MSVIPVEQSMLKRIVTRFCVVALAFLAGTGITLQPDHAMAANYAVRNIAIVNLAWIARESRAMRSAQEQRGRFEKNFEGDYTRTFQELQNIDQELTRLKASLNSSDFEQRRSDFERRFKTEEERLGAKQAKIRDSYNSGVDQIEKKLLDIIMDISKSRDINLVFGKNAIVIAQPDYDISEEVLTRLNQELPSVVLVQPF